MATPLPVSHTTLEAHETCPRKFEAEKVIKIVKDVKNAASIWGDEVHKAMDAYIKSGGAQKLPDSMVQYDQYIRQFVTRPGTTVSEQYLAIDKRFKPCGFYDKGVVFLRGIIDVLTILADVADVDDHKTGKPKTDVQQLVIFALLVFYTYPHVNTVRCRFQWLVGGTVTERIFTREQIPELWDMLLPKLHRYKRSFQTGKFQPRPSGLCVKYCGVKDCEYFGRGTR